MKRIKGADVRNGDTIRREYAAPTSSLRAVEFVAKGACPDNGDALYLLDPPVPAVELPTVPTLGWVNHEMSSIEIFLAAVDAANRADR